MEQIIELTCELISHANYIKDNVNNSVETVAKKLSAWGLQPQVFINQGYKMLCTSVGEGEITLILNGHLDVVPAVKDQFIPKVSKGKLYGRGSYDMLGAVAAMMLVMKTLAKDRPNLKVILMLVPTEETDGTIGTKYLIENGFAGDFAICGEPTNLRISPVAKGVLQLKLTIFGQSAHGSKPWLGENAICKAMDVYNKIAFLPFASKSNSYYSGPSINLAKLNVGNVINRVPDVAEMYLDIRYLNGQNPEHIIEEIKRLDYSAEIQVLQKGDAVMTSLDNHFIKVLLNCVAKENVECGIMAQHGSADTRFFQAAGIPSVEFGPVGADHHGFNEHVEINSLYKYKTILLNFINQ